MPIGRPIANTQLYVLDGRLNAVPAGVSGELYIGGDGLARGYLNRPDLTAERFVPDPFSSQPGRRLYKTGDLVRYRSDGNLEYLGRLDHQVKVRGFRIELGEIESALLSHSRVREAVVIVREDTPGDKRLVAYIVGDSSLGISEMREYLQEKLPDYMIPSAFVMLNVMPLTPNGKVDRNGLPAPDTTRPDIAITYKAPTNAIEKVLASIWCAVLHLQQVGVNDNFFELGGDSILSIQIIARANREGLRLTPRHVFQYQTIAGLAGVVDTVSVLPIERGVESGPTPLTPIQHWFFERDLPDRHYFNQGRLLVFRQRVCSEYVERVCHLVVEHHDALRMRFERTESGWQQAHVSREENSFFTRVDLSGLAAADLGSAITDSCSQLQSSLDLTNGPLLRVAYFDLGPDQAARLFIVIHHLVVDGVSWGVLLSDLCLGLEQLERGEEPGLGSRTTSFQSWSKRLTEYAQSIALRNEQDYWLSETRRIVSCIPCDHSNGLNTVSSQNVLDVALDESETRALLQEVPAVYHTQINDVLLSALAQALGSWSGEKRVLVDLEGHGREPLFEDVDLSSSVGWFTSLFPVLLELPSVPGPGELLKSVKEQLRLIPNHGIGYGVLRYLSSDADVKERLARLPGAQVSFNYLGRFDEVLSDTSFFAAAPEETGSMYSSLGKRSYALGVLSRIRQGRLEVSWNYSEELFQRSTVRGLAVSYLAALRAMILHCKSPDAGGHTPSDFPRAKVSQAALDRLTAGMRKH